ncbi:unnamed protein product [Camellia sinensis]
MATRVKVLCTSVFLLLLLLSHDIISIEGRQLKGEKNNKCKKCAGMDENGQNSHSQNEAVFKTSESGKNPGGGGDVAAESKDDFQSTGPGHSPGVGHSLGPSRSV